MYLIKRLLIILIAVAAVIGATYAVVQARGGAGAGNFRAGRGNPPGGENFAPDGQPPAGGQFPPRDARPEDDGAGRGAFFGLGQVIRNLFVIGVITAIVIAGSFFFGWFRETVLDNPPA